MRSLSACWDFFFRVAVRLASYLLVSTIEQPLGQYLFAFFVFLWCAFRDVATNQ
eukprot:m.759612 g.759612  ORF g.759612 m.759612 type:complete len:54 (-) comp59043_c0_seq48:14-175(-)